MGECCGGRAADFDLGVSNERLNQTVGSVSRCRCMQLASPRSSGCGVPVALRNAAEVQDTCRKASSDRGRAKDPHAGPRQRLLSLDQIYLAQQMPRYFPTRIVHRFHEHVVDIFPVWVLFVLPMQCDAMLPLAGRIVEGRDKRAGCELGGNEGSPSLWLRMRKTPYSPTLSTPKPCSIAD